jgi:hypothetical protein
LRVITEIFAPADPAISRDPKHRIEITVLVIGDLLRGLYHEEVFVWGNSGAVDAG